VLANNQILSETCNALQNPARVEAWRSKLPDWQIKMLRHIYASGPRGLSGHELSGSILETERNTLVKFLSDAIEKMFCYRKRTSQGHYVYYGFLEYADAFLPAPAPFAEHKAGKAVWTGHASVFEWHLVKLLARAMRSSLHIGNTGKFLKRDLNGILTDFGNSKLPLEGALDCEVALAFQFLQDRQWLQTQGLLVRPTDAATSFLQDSGIRLPAEILQWWTGTRFKGNAEPLRFALSRLEQPVALSSAAELFWPFDPATKPGKRIPRPLLELWILGLVEFAVEEGALTGCSLSRHGREWLGLIVPSLPRRQRSCLPNFEAILSTDSNPWLLFLAACLSKSENDDWILKFSLQRDFFLDALHKGVPERFVQELFQWRLPENVAGALSDWLAVFSTARLSVSCLLKVTDEGCRETLAGMPQFQECALEAIPGYGFVVKQEASEQILQILRSMGLSPPPLPVEQDWTPFQSQSLKENFELPWPETSEADFSKAPALDAGPAWNSTKYNTAFRKLSAADLEQVLRYALLTGIPLEAEVPPEEHTDSDKSIEVVPFQVRKLKSRAKIPAVEAEVLPSKTRRLIPYEKIVRLRLTRV
jgi:hypothetical protein